MRVQVKLFGILRTWVDDPVLDVVLEENASVARLLEEIENRIQKPLTTLNLSVSVNSQLAVSGTKLWHEDEVVLIPPLAGG